MFRNKFLKAIISDKQEMLRPDTICLLALPFGVCQ